MLQEKDFLIKTLGKATVISPIEFSTTHGDGIVNFIEDDITIPYSIQSCGDSSVRGLAFESAGSRKMIYFQPDNVIAGIMTCGGLCPGLNDAIRSIIMQLFYKYGVSRILGIRYGQKGLDPDSNHEPIRLTPDYAKNIHLRGGSVLGTSRGRVDTDIMVDSLEKYGINTLFCLGGDGTQKGLHDIYRVITERGLNISVVGVPKTIDNDLWGTDVTFGFDTAINIAMKGIDRLHTTAKSHNRVMVIEVMGRHAGWIALEAGLAGSADIILLPEVP